MLQLDHLKYIFFFFFCYTLIPQQDNYQSTSNHLYVIKLSHYPSKTYPLKYPLKTLPLKSRSLMNCVNSISQMNSCEHSSLIPQDKKGDKPPGPDERKTLSNLNFTEQITEKVTKPNWTRLLFKRSRRDSKTFFIFSAGEGKEYPPLLPPGPGGPGGPESCPSSPRSRSPQSLRSPSQLSDYSGRHHSPDHLMSRSNSERSSTSGKTNLTSELYKNTLIELKSSSNTILFFFIHT